MYEIEEYLASKALAENTQQQYRRVLERFLADNPQLETLTAGKFKDWLDGIGWGGSMRWVAYCCIRSFLRHGYGESHPATKLRIKRGESAPQRTLKRSQAEALLASFDTSTPKGRRDLAMCCLMLDSGLRRAEICRLQLEHLDLDERRLRVLVKGGHWGDGVYSDYTASCLARWLADRERLALAGEGAVFVSIGGNTRGRHLHPGGMEVIVRGWAKAAGIKKLSPHDLRRSFATLALRAGAPSRVVQAAGRWSKIEMVERYSRVIEAEDLAPWFPVGQVMHDS